MTQTFSANRDRVIDRFVTLARIRSPLLEVGEIMSYLRGWARLNGFSIQVDEAGKDLAGFQSGNTFIDIPATNGLEHQTWKAVEAHVDTVDLPAGKSVSPVVDGDIIRTDGSTILGADDKAGVTANMEAVQLLKETNAPHGPIQLIISVGEEGGGGKTMYGVREMDYSLVRAQSILCVDGEEIDLLYTACPSKLKWLAKFKGRAAHGGQPESGVNAVLMAARALTKAFDEELFGNPPGAIRGEQGLLDTIFHNVSENVSHLKGQLLFTNTNVVPETAYVAAELRCYQPEEMERIFDRIQMIFHRVAATTFSEDRQHHGSVEWETERPYEPFSFPDDHPLVQEVLQAMKAAGIPNAHTGPCFGTTHSNVYVGRGIPSIILGAGSRNPHSVDEHVVISEMAKAAEVIAHYLQAD